MRLSKSSFLIAGGSSGLGAACVRLFSQAGAEILIADINSEAGRRLAGECGVRFVRTDVTDESSVEHAVNSAVESFGKLNGAVICAGICPPERVLSAKGPQPLTNFSRVINVNLMGTFNVIRLAAAAIAQGEPDSEGERGVIVSTASIAAYDGQIGQASYAASKGGVAAMTLPIARELARYGIRIVSIAPGIFDTPMMAGLPEQARQTLSEQIPFPRRLGRPEEYAFMVRHVIENVMLNGAVIRLDGALRMPPK
jgi:NAD(P)-dependent dehydrogenase (short-subunit alcohol dehydrogenase family)